MGGIAGGALNFSKILSCYATSST
ncbi:GLUG motif-containing protein [Pseudomonas migulae]